MFGALLGGLAGLGEAVFGSHSQRDANRTNIKLQREQQAWEERMSNTAITRAANDIEAAGGNRALAFTTGREASTPTVTPARVEPTYRPSGSIAATAATGMQLQQMQAQTNLINAQTKSLNIKNSVDNVYAPQIAAINYDLKVMQKQKGEKEWDYLESQLEANLKQTLASARNLEASANMTGLQAGQFKRMTDAIVSLAVSQAKTASLDVQALENIAEMYGIEASKSKGIIDTIVNSIKVFARGAAR